MSKALSPLVASVVLIAFTISIAFIVANWATTFVTTTTSDVTSEVQCIGALDVDLPSYTGTTLSVRVSNFNDKLALTSLKISLYYTDPAANQENLDSGIATLEPGNTQTIVKTSATKPKSVRVVAANCPKYPRDVTVP
ncbi:MAG: archaellin/type IV pilin N-terminal domain-containing protein [Candidatus Aenigmatarchaeota archaeon]